MRSCPAAAPIAGVTVGPHAWTGIMNAVSTSTPMIQIDAAAAAAHLTPEQTRSFGHMSVTMGNEGMMLTVTELAAGAELTAGRIDFVEYRRRCRD